MSTTNIQMAVTNLTTDLNVIKSHFGVNVNVTHNNDASAPKLVVYCASAYHAYVPKKYDGFEVLFRDWNGGGVPWIDEFFQIETYDYNYIAGWY